MNDGLEAPTALAERTAPVSIAQAMPTAIALYLNDDLFERVSAISLRISKASGITPAHLIGHPEACFAVVSRAITWRLDPFAVAMATYQTPGGSIGFEGKLVLAILENSGRIEGGVHFAHYGDWSRVQGKFAIRESDKGKKFAVPTWSDDDARKGIPDDRAEYSFAQSCGVRVTARIRGESEPRRMDFDLIQAQPRHSTLWATDPKTQICYTAARRFANAVVPSLMMGVPFDPVDMFNAPIDITPTARDEISLPRAKSEAPAPVEQAADAGGSVDESLPPEEQSEQLSPATTSQGDLIDTATGEIRDPEKAPAVATNGKRASDAQRRMIIDVAKRQGLTVAQLDERLVPTLGMGIDELPMKLVNQTLQLVRALKADAA